MTDRPDAPATRPRLIFDDMAEFAARLGPGQRLMGFDFGTKTIGLALSDTGRRIASPLETLARRRFTQDAERIVGLARAHAVGGLVIGLPINMDGSEGPRAQSTRQFARNLSRHLDVPMVFWDERLSTAAVTRTLLEADASRARRKELVDKMAASYILQGALDRLGRIQTG